MLVGKRESIWAHTTHAKDFMVVMEPSECGIEGIKRIFCENVLACNITTVKECVQRLDDVHMHITLKHIHEDLIELSTLRRNSGVVYYLHKCLRIVSSPLLEVAALFESSEAGKKRCKCDAIKN